MTDLEKLRMWIGTYPSFDILGSFKLDYADQIPVNEKRYPSGLEELSRVEDIQGNITVQNQYNLGLYHVFAYPTEGNGHTAINTDWIMDFQRWVQEQSVRHLAPTFGDDPKTERIRAQNGVLYAADKEGTATYTVQLSINFTKFYKE